MKDLKDRQVTLLLIDDNHAPFILPLIRCFAGFRNIHLDVLVISEEAPHLYRYSRHIRRIFHVKGRIEERFEKGIREVVPLTKPDMVIPTREWISSILARERGWLEKMVPLHPVAREALLETVTDKWLLNEWLKSNDFPSTHSYLPDHRGAVPEEIRYPCLLKPRTGAGGEGIVPVKDRATLERILSNGPDTVKNMVLQEHVHGFDIDMSFFAVDGEIRFFTIQQGLISGSYVFPKAIRFVKNPVLQQLVSDMVRNLGYTGIAHLDFRYDPEDDNYYLVDFNARYWSSLQGSKLMGVNFPLLILYDALDIPFEVPEAKEGTFFYGTAALTQLWKNLFASEKIPVRLRYTQLPSIVRDPLPELFFFTRNLFRFKTL